MPHLYSPSSQWKPRKKDPPKVSNLIERDWKERMPQIQKKFQDIYWACLAWILCDLMILANLSKTFVRALGVDAVSRSTMMKALGSSSDSGWRQVLNLMLPFTESLVVTHGFNDVWPKFGPQTNLFAANVGIMKAKLRYFNILSVWKVIELVDNTFNLQTVLAEDFFILTYSCCLYTEYMIIYMHILTAICANNNTSTWPGVLGGLGGSGIIRSLEQFCWVPHTKTDANPKPRWPQVNGHAFGEEVSWTYKRIP